jgi:hypothetical protein
MPKETYSPNCLEEEFSELRQLRFLGSSRQATVDGIMLL